VPQLAAGGLCHRATSVFTQDVSFATPASASLISGVRQRPVADVTLAPGARGTGLREWFAAAGKVDVAAAAFDTRLDSAALLTGRASKGIARLLREHGCTLTTSPKSFLVTGDNQLRAGEEDRAPCGADDIGDHRTSPTISGLSG